MAALREWMSRLWGTLGRSRADRDLEEELRSHLELAADDARRRGESPERAMRAARLRAGHLTQSLESMRDQRALPWVEDLVRDIRYGCRMLARTPGFTAVAVISLAVGIGANVATFSFVDALLLRPLTVPHPDGVLTVGSTAAVEGFSSLVASYPEYRDIRDRSRTFAGLVASTAATFGFSADAASSPKLRYGMLVSGNFFDVMGVAPAVGRGFRADEDQVPGRNAVAVIGYDCWQQQFGGDPAVLGRRFRLNGVEFTVVGVAPPSFLGLYQYARVDFYVPTMMWPRLLPDAAVPPLENRDARSLIIKGRLRPGVTLAAARDDLAVIGRDLERAYPETNRHREFSVRTELGERLSHDRGGAVVLAMLTTLSGIVLFVACANVAGLLTSRAPSRAREVAMRLAIGAGRARLIRQFITESVLLAIAGGTAGIAVGSIGIRLFQKIQLPTDLPLALAVELDRRALVFSLIVASLSAVLCGLMPAVHATRADLTAVMKASDATASGRRRWGRAMLVSGQVAASVVLLVVATFMYRNFQRQLGAGPGYRTDHLLMMSVDPTLVRRTGPAAQQFFERLAARVRATPGVRSAALTSSVPMGTEGFGVVAFVPAGVQLPEGKDNVTVLGSIVDEGYFATMAVPIVRGRGFLATDTADAAPVAIVNEQLARHYWPDQDVIGRRFRLNDARGPLVEIVGLAKMSKYTFLAEPPTDFIYLPFRQKPQPRLTLLAESSSDSASLAGPLADVVHELDPVQPVYNVRTMEAFYRMRVVVAFNVVIGSVAAMGFMGLGLSIVGLYGLVAYGVSRRTKEIGIRMAIGAGASTVLGMVLRQGMNLAVAGLLLGLVAGAGARRLLAAAFGNPLRAFDPVPFLMVGGVVLAVTLLATYVPARRAAHINPTDALRNE
jgi:putative ABC transport system permease protein